MIDLVWNFPLLPEQKEIWAKYLAEAMRAYGAEPVESLRPSFRNVEPMLRERAARYLGFPMERTWITGGGHHGTLNALLASGLAGTRFAVEGTTYPGFLDQCLMTKTAVDACEIDDEGLVPASLRAVCAAAKAEGKPVRGLFTMPTVQNPMGFVTRLARRLEIVAMAREFDLTIIEDDAYGYMQEPAPPNYAVLAPERTYYGRGISKSFAPGARTGFLVAPESAAAGLVMSLKCTTTGSDVPQNMAVLAMMEDGTLERLMAEKRVEGAVRNLKARALLGGVAAPGAAAAWHLWVPLGEGVDLVQVERRINDADVIVTMGKWCAASPEYARGMRLALGGEVDRSVTLEGVSRVGEVLRSV